MSEWTARWLRIAVFVSTALPAAACGFGGDDDSASDDDGQRADDDDGAEVVGDDDDTVPQEDDDDGEQPKKPAIRWLNEPPGEIAPASDGSLPGFDSLCLGIDDEVQLPDGSALDTTAFDGTLGPPRVTRLGLTAVYRDALYWRAQAGEPEQAIPIVLADGYDQFAGTPYDDYAIIAATEQRNREADPLTFHKVDLVSGTGTFVEYAAEGREEATRLASDTTGVFAGSSPSFGEMYRTAWFYDPATKHVRYPRMDGVAEVLKDSGGKISAELRRIQYFHPAALLQTFPRPTESISMLWVCTLGDDDVCTPRFSRVGNETAPVWNGALLSDGALLWNHGITPPSVERDDDDGNTLMTIETGYEFEDAAPGTNTLWAQVEIEVTSEVRRYGVARVDLDALTGEFVLSGDFDLLYADDGWVYLRHTERSAGHESHAVCALRE